MKLSWCPYSLHFKHPFGLSYGTRTTTEVVFAKLESNEFTGYGEASLPPYLGESQQSVTAFFSKAKAVLQNINREEISEVLKEIDKLEPGNNAAKAALDIALHDLKGKQEGKTIWELYGLSHPEPKHTSVTISIGDKELIPQKIKEQEDFQILKIKLGTNNDREIVEAIRKHTDKALVLDVNQGWKDKQFALEMTEWLKDKNVLFIEQPLPKENMEDAIWLKERSALPIMADEAFKRFEDLGKVADAYHGINIKLMKCTGIYEAYRIAQEAKRRGLKINLGCMAESSCAVSAASQLMGLADWIDLDGPLLVDNDPFEGVGYAGGKVFSPVGAGTGISLSTFGKSLTFS